MADIRALELEFARNPTLDACVPLCEAYLVGKRYMEAMVVCKKGIKQAPQDPRGRVLLARVFLDQGKIPKAEQEIVGALKDFPGNPFAAELMGQILVQQGRNQEAVPFLQQALSSAPDLQRARALLQHLGGGAPQAAPQAPQPQQRPAQPGMQPMQPGMRPMQPGMRPMQPGMQPMQPGMQPMQPGMQPMQPGMRPGAPQTPWATGVTAPNFSPPQMMPGQAPGGAPPMPAAPGKPQGPKLEHVSDFFADDTLGFQSDGSHIETAGPGRLTILGFVPKSTGSIKTTIIVALALFAVASVVVVWQYVSSKNTREIARLYGQMKAALDEDKLARYHDALEIGQEVFKIDEDHNQTLSAMAYAEAVLGNDHQEDGAIERARAYLQRAVATGEQNTEYRVAASALLAYYAHEYDRGIAEVKEVQLKGGSATQIEVEMLRLRNAISPSDKETLLQLQRVNEMLTYHARGYVLLGWYYYGQEDWTRADKFFDEALKNSKDHPVALLGQALTDLDRNIGLDERQKEIGERIKKVHVLPKDELSRPTLALAHFTRAQLLAWQGKKGEADADYKKAFELNPNNVIFPVARARLAINTNHWVDAIEHLRDAAKLDPNNPRLYKKLCRAQTQVGDTKSAAASCKRAEELSGGKDLEARFLDCERQRGEKAFDEAIKCYQAIPMEAGPDLYAQSRIAVGKAQRAQKKFNDSALSLTEFLENAPAGLSPPRIAEAWCEMGLAYELAKQASKALDCYRFGIEQFAYYAPCHAYLCLAMKPNDPEVREACGRYLKVDPKGEFIDKVNAKLKRLR